MTIIDDVWGKLPDKLAFIKRRKCHGLIWRYDMIDTRTRKTVKSSNSESKLVQWANINGWTIPKIARAK